MIKNNKKNVSVCKILKNSLLFLPFFLLPAYASAAVAVTSHAANTGSGTFSFNCSGGNYLLLAEQTQTGFPSMGTPTYNGVNMTQLVSVTGSPFGQLWGLASPASGSNTVDPQYTGSDSGRTGVEVICLSGVSGVGTGQELHGWPIASGADKSLTDTNAVAGDMFVAFAWDGNNATISSSSSTQQDYITPYGQMWSFTQSGVTSMPWHTNQSGSSYGAFVGVNVVGIH